MEFGYAFAILNLSIVFAILGEALFIIASAIRIAGNPEKISKVKAFFMTIVIAVIIEAIGYNLFCNCNKWFWRYDESYLYPKNES